MAAIVAGIQIRTSRVGVQVVHIAGSVPSRGPEVAVRAAIVLPAIGVAARERRREVILETVRVSGCAIGISRVKGAMVGDPGSATISVAGG